MRRKTAWLLGFGCYLWGSIGAGADLPQVFRLDGLRKPVVMVEQIGDEVLVSVEMRPVNALAAGTNERLSRERAEAYAIEGLRRFFGQPARTRVSISGLETIEVAKLEDRYCLSLKVAKVGIRFHPDSSTSQTAQLRRSLKQQEPTPGLKSETGPAPAIIPASRAEDVATIPSDATGAENPEVLPEEEKGRIAAVETEIPILWTARLPPKFSRSEFEAAANTAFFEFADRIPSRDLPKATFEESAEELLAWCDEAVIEGAKTLAGNPLILTLESEELLEFLRSKQQAIEAELKRQVEAYDAEFEQRQKQASKFLRKKR